MTCKTAAILLLISIVAAPGAIAADAAGNYAIWGVGRTSCHQFLKTGADDARFRPFAMGYLTAFNTLSEDTYNATGSHNLESAFEWLRGYCEAHQMDSFDRALQQMLSEWFESRHRVPPGRQQGWGQSATPKREPPARQGVP